MHTATTTLREEMRAELTEHILPYWMKRTPDATHGGFVGRITHDDRIEANADKAVVLHARILWTFSAALRVLRDEAYRPFADRAYAYLRSAFLDEEHGGYFWMVSADGRPVDRRKQIYAQAFVLYGFSEYYRATEHAPALEAAREVYDLIERHAHDAEHGGYHEAFDASWQLLDDVRLSEKDANERKSMNTHLHVLEAYANYHTIRSNRAARARLRELIALFLKKMFDERTGHYALFFDDDWRPKSRAVSYGHDIEAAWLLLEAAKQVGEQDFLSSAAARCTDLARITIAQAQDDDGGLFNDGDASGVVDTDKHWWPQAEAMVGFVCAFELTRDAAFLHAAESAWHFIKSTLVDAEHGEWFGRVSREGRPYETDDKVGSWKCPYHNGRACLEIIRRLGAPTTSTVDD